MGRELRPLKPISYMHPTFFKPSWPLPASGSLLQPSALPSESCISDVFHGKKRFHRSLARYRPIISLFFKHYHASVRRSSSWSLI